MKIGMACDHGAYTYKEEIKQMLIDEGHEVVDCVVMIQIVLITRIWQKRVQI